MKKILLSDDPGSFSAQLLEAVNVLAIPHAGAQVAPHVTISIGGATCRPSRDLSPDALISAADTHLYEAKGAGKNRAVWTALGESEHVTHASQAGAR